MVVQAIREFIHASPFVPFELHMASGEKYRVPHPDFVHISPKTSFVLVFDDDERPHHLNTILIERASLSLNRRRIRRGRKAA